MGLIFKLFNILLILFGLMAFIGGIFGIKEEFQKRKFGKNFWESIAMLLIGIYTVLWLITHLLY